MLFICYPKCTTCQKAEQYLKEKGITYEKRDIKLAPPTVAELKKWHDRSALPLKRFFNTSGQKYKELALKDRLIDMPLEEQYALLASDGMLVKRPLCIGDDFVLVGFKVKEWDEKIKKM